MTKVTCSPVDALPSGPSSRFRQCSCATAHAGEKCNPIIGTLRYMKMQEHISVGVHYIFLPSVYYNAGAF